jgi:hypothetical protein
MQAEGTPKRRTASAWREAADLLRFSLEAGAVSGAIVMIAWVFSSTG